MNNKYKNFDWHSVGLNFGNWEESKIWELNLPIEKMDVEELLWHLDIPYWENNDDVRWTITPRDVLNKEEGTSQEYERMLQADTSYAIDVFFANGKWYVLDGLHRLAKLHAKGEKEIHVHKIPKERFHEIESKFPIELPDECEK